MNYVVLRNISDRLFKLIQMSIEIKIVYKDITRVCRPHAVESIHQRGFTCAGRAEESDKLIRWDRKRDIVEELYSSTAESILHFLREPDTVDPCLCTGIEDAYRTALVYL